MPGLFQDIQKCILIQSIFQDILVCSQAHGLLDILKIIMTTQNHDVYIFLLFPDMAYQFNAVHKRHGDVCDDHVNLLFLQNVQGLLAVLYILYHLISCFLPGIQSLQITPD